MSANIITVNGGPSPFAGAAGIGAEQSQTLPAIDAGPAPVQQIVKDQSAAGVASAEPPAGGYVRGPA
jgi:hypothetical protein